MEKNVQVAISFDTTGSMYPCLTQVRRVVDETTKRLFNDIQNLSIAIIAHGDYCDYNSPYITKHMDFTSDRERISNFIMNVAKTGGGDSPECYELVLNKVRTELSWEPNSTRIFILIGDDIPHPVGYRYGSFHNTIDWRRELVTLKEDGINIYSVHCMPGIRKHSRSFYTEIAEKTGGFYLTLDQFSSVTDLIMGICYKQEGDESLDRFEKELRDSNRYTKNMERSFDSLRGIRRDDDEAWVDESYDYTTTSTKRRPSGPVKYSKLVGEGLIPVPTGRFQVLYVEHDIPIRDFADEQGVEFAPGRGFYELTKSEKVQQYKEIILQDKNTGEIFNGTQVREMLGLSPQIDNRGGETEKLKPVWLDKYKVFVQSTSYTRKLIGGTSLMYEVIDK